MITISIRINPKADMQAGICTFCRHPVSPNNGFVELYGLFGTLLSYPSIEADEPVALFGHDACGPDCGYSLAFHQFTGNIEERYGIIWHVSQKNWCSALYLDAMRAAAKIQKSRKPVTT